MGWATSQLAFAEHNGSAAEPMLAQARLFLIRCSAVDRQARLDPGLGAAANIGHAPIVSLDQEASGVFRPAAGPANHQYALVSRDIRKAIR